MNVVALLESMWGWRGYSEAGDVIRYFRINPDNFSGRRLYSLVGSQHSLLVTNSCRECQASANDHGKPDPVWVADNLRFLASEKMDLLLVCGKVAKATYEQCGFVFPRVIFMDHPAARRWTGIGMEMTRAQIALKLAEATQEKEVAAS
jgi:hypothetical protein